MDGMDETDKMGENRQLKMENPEREKNARFDISGSLRGGLGLDF